MISDTEKQERASPEFTRQEGIVAPEKLKIPITVIGAGGIGSFTVDQLTKMGCSNITVFDHDMVEPHNMPNQRFGPADVGKLKVIALRDFIRMSTGKEIKAIPRKWTPDDKLNGIVISAVDSMRVRKQIWRKVKNNPAVKLFIDGRIGGEYSEVYPVRPVVDPDSVRFYASTLFKDKDSADLPCTEQAIIYVGNGIAFRIAAVVGSYAEGRIKQIPPVIRDDYRNVTVEIT